MQILNLTNVDKSDIKYSISRFPDGEVQITLEEFSHKDYIIVNCRITNTEELFVLMQVADILNRHEVIWYLNIYYLMGMRMDRVMDFNRPFTLKIMQNILTSLGASRIGIFEPHSERCSEPNNIFSYIDPPSLGEEEICQFCPIFPQVREKYQIVLPDKGAIKRSFFRKVPESIIVADKVRDITTGRIQSIKIINPELLEKNDKSILVVDDLCDGGGTFVGLAAELKKYTDKELNIFVTHMVNPKGIENLSKTYDHVWFTNSYKDWNGFKTEYGKVIPALPENVTQINVI